MATLAALGCARSESEPLAHESAQATRLLRQKSAVVAHAEEPRLLTTPPAALVGGLARARAHIARSQGWCARVRACALRYAGMGAGRLPSLGALLIGDVVLTVLAMRERKNALPQCCGGGGIASFCQSRVGLGDMISAHLVRFGLDSADLDESGFKSTKFETGSIEDGPIIDTCSSDAAKLGRARPKVARFRPGGRMQRSMQYAGHTCR